MFHIRKRKDTLEHKCMSTSFLHLTQGSPISSLWFRAGPQAVRNQAMEVVGKCTCDAAFVKAAPTRNHPLSTIPPPLPSQKGWRPRFNTSLPWMLTAAIESSHITQNDIAVLRNCTRVLCLSPLHYGTPFYPSESKTMHSPKVKLWNWKNETILWMCYNCTKKICNKKDCIFSERY